MGTLLLPRTELPLSPFEKGEYESENDVNGDDLQDQEQLLEPIRIRS
ncbi:MAG: hypothetical protein F6K11_03305 [Leptolyngbya sp. SIO3F4]|nr:hypothetical protein [Leptolyngbya sp. SIO3F4]